MEVQLDTPASEIKRLQGCMNDLASLLALRARWAGGEPSQIARALLDVLPGMVPLDLLYIRLKGAAGQMPVEMVRVDPSRELKASPQEVGEALNRCLGDDPQKWSAQVRSSIGNGNLSIVPLQLGPEGEIGVLVAGAARADFPGQTDRLLLGVAANQAASGLREAWLLSEQKRIAEELDQRVALRISELAAANDELRRELAEQQRGDEAPRQSEAQHHVFIFDTL